MRSSLTPKDLLKESLHAMIPSNQLGTTAARAHWLRLARTPTAFTAWLTDLIILIQHHLNGKSIFDGKIVAYLVTCHTLHNLQRWFQLIEANWALRSSDSYPALLHLLPN